jgi:TolC family type I secretion outer membrane protein
LTHGRPPARCAPRTGVVYATIACGVFAFNPAHSETLEEALALAYQTNPQILAARAGLRATDEGVAIARANWRPSLAVTGTAGRESISQTSMAAASIPSQALPLSTTTANSWSATVTQPIYRGGQTTAQVSQALLTVDAGRAQLLTAESAVLFQVASAYLGCLLDEQLLALTTQGEELLRQELAAVDTELRLAVATGPDRLQVESLLASATAARLQARGVLQGSDDAYLRIVGHAPDQLTVPTLRPLLPDTREEALHIAATTSPAVVAADNLRDAGAKAIDAATGKLRPQVSLAGSYSRYSVPPVDGINQGKLNDKIIELEVTFPLYDAGATYAEARQAKQVFEQLRQSADDTHAASVQLTGQAWDTLETERDILPELTHAAKAAEEAYNGVVKQQKLGLKTITDVLVAEQNLIQARIARTTAQFGGITAEFALAQQLGMLTGADLKLNVPLYDATEHFKQVQYKWIGLGSGAHDTTR